MLPRQLVLEPAQVLKLLIGKLVMIEVELGQDHQHLLAQVELVLQRPLWVNQVRILVLALVLVVEAWNSWAWEESP
jgi:hypothetical protein